jgi:hypothetical protein
MMVRDLISALAQEDDMDSSVFVRYIDSGGNIHFIAIEGIATILDAYKAFHEIPCTTLLLDA